MSFSQLKALESESLSFSQDDCALYGSICGFPLCVADNVQEHSFTVTIFAAVPLAEEGVVSAQINRLAGLLPRNAVRSQKSELNYLQVTLSSLKLFDDSLPLLLDFIDGLCAFLQEKSFASGELDKKDCGLCIFRKAAVRKPVSEPSLRFDKRSIYGLIGALIGAVACAVIWGFAISLSLDTGNAEPAVTTAAEQLIPAIEVTRTNNIGAELASWAAGAITAAVILIDYRFFARKTDIFGIVSCSVLTLGAVLAGTLLCGVRTLYSMCGDMGIKTNFFMIISDIDYYNGLIPQVGEGLVFLLLKGVFTAIIASGIYYVWYFRKHADVMYQKKES